MFGYIYKTTNKINGKIYIGQRLGKFKPSYLGSGKIIKQAIEAYGRDNFSLQFIAYLTCREHLDEFEIFMISKYREILGTSNVYNLSDGGVGKRGTVSFETRKKIGEKNRRPNNKLKNRQMSFSHREKLKIAWIERRKRGFSQETRDKMRKSHLGLRKNFLVQVS